MERSPENALAKIIGWCWHCGTKVWAGDEEVMKYAGHFYCSYSCLNHPPTPHDNPELF